MKKIAIALMGLLAVWVGSLAWQVQARATETTSSLTAGNMSLVGHVGGQAEAIAVAGNYAYLGIGPDLIILSISDPMTPTQVGSILLPNTVQDVAVVGTHAYVVEGTSGLQVIDVSNPAHPAIVGTLVTSGNAQRIVVAGNYAYIAAGGGGLRIINVSNPANPIEVGNYSVTSWTISRVVINGNYAYVLAAGIPQMGDGLVTLNISNPAAPVQTNLSDTYWYSTDLAIANGSLYVGFYICPPFVSCINGGLQTFHLTNPAVPAANTVYLASGPVMVIAVSGNHAYLGIGGVAAPALEIVNTTSMAQESLNSMAGVIHQFRFANNRLYSASGNRGLRILNVSNSANPIELGAYDQGVALNSMDTVTNSGDFVYTTGLYGLQVFNVATPTLPTASGSYGFGPSYSWFSSNAAVANDYAYVARSYLTGNSETSIDFDVLHVSNPNALTKVGGTNLKFTTMGNPPAGAITSVSAIGQDVYVSDSGSLWRINVTTPTTPTIASVYNTWEANPSTMRINSAVVTGTLAYLAEVDFWTPTNPRLVALDMSAPLTPTEVNTYTVSSSVTQLAAQDHYLFAADGYGLLILDIADPNHIAEIGRYALSGTINDLVVAGNYAYLAMPDGVRVIDVSDPAHFDQVAVYPLAYGATAVAIRGNYVYVTSGENGLFVLQLWGTVAGRITTSAFEPVAGVVVALSSGSSLTTTIDGLYTFMPLPAGSYVVTPALSGYVFWPPTRTLHVPSLGATAAKFVMLPQPVSTNIDPGTAITVSYTDTQGLRTDLFFPVGAVSQTTALTVTPVMIDDRLPDQAFAGHAFDLAAQPDQVFNMPVTTTIRYSESDMRVISDENSLALLWWNGSSWVDATTPCAPSSSYQRDVVNKTIAVPICRTGRYALFGPTHQIYLPLVFR